MYGTSVTVYKYWVCIRSKRRQVGSATNKTATRRNGDNLIGDNSVISATDSQNGEKAASQNGDNDRRRGGKREKEEGRGGNKNNHKLINTMK